MPYRPPLSGLKGGYARGASYLWFCFWGSPDVEAFLARMATAYCGFISESYRDRSEPDMRATIASVLLLALLKSCASAALPEVESNARLTDLQAREMARQYLSMLPDELKIGSPIQIDECHGGLGASIDARRRRCDLYISHAVDGCTYGARVFRVCNPDRRCIFEMEAYARREDCGESWTVAVRFLLISESFDAAGKSV